MSYACEQKIREKVVALSLSKNKHVRKFICIIIYLFCLGTAVMINIWSIHHNSSHYENPFEFKPTRFLDADGQLLPASKLRHFIPFSAGPRECLGQTLGRTELFLFLANLLYNYRFESSSLNQSLDLHGTTKVTHAPKPYKVLLSSRLC